MSGERDGRENNKNKKVQELEHTVQRRISNGVVYGFN
jgi:hypothetical protein